MSYNDTKGFENLSVRDNLSPGDNFSHIKNTLPATDNFIFDTKYFHLETYYLSVYHFTWYGNWKYISIVRYDLPLVLFYRLHRVLYRKPYSWKIMCIRSALWWSGILLILKIVFGIVASVFVSLMIIFVFEYWIGSTINTIHPKQ